jgi:hypothetical protein
MTEFPLAPLPKYEPPHMNPQTQKDVLAWAGSDAAKEMNEKLGAEFQKQVENALGIPHDLMEQGREIMATQMRLVQKQLAIGLEPVLGRMEQGMADRYREMAKDLAAQIVLRGGKPPAIHYHVEKTNTSRSWAKNKKLGRHAERMAARWPSWHRRHKKWMWVAAKCGVILWADVRWRNEKPVETIQINFTIVPNGDVAFS